MTTLLANTLARLRVCRDAGLPVSHELLSDAAECLERVADADARRAQRDAMIRRAALLLPSAPVHTQAGALASEAKVMARTWHVLRSRSPDSPETVRACLHAAGLHAKLPASKRQFDRILREESAADIVGRSHVSAIC